MAWYQILTKARVSVASAEVGAFALVVPAPASQCSLVQSSLHTLQSQTLLEQGRAASQLPESSETHTENERNHPWC